jgi:hypothetical protein
MSFEILMSGSDEEISQHGDVDSARQRELRRCGPNRALLPIFYLYREGDTAH